MSGMSAPTSASASGGSRFGMRVEVFLLYVETGDGTGHMEVNGVFSSRANAYAAAQNLTRRSTIMPMVLDAWRRVPS